MENTNIAAAAVNVNQARTHSQIATATLKQSLDTQQNVADSLASSAGRVGDIMESGQAVIQSSRLFDTTA